MKTKDNPDFRSLLIGIFLIITAYLFAAILNSLVKMGISNIPLSTILFIQNFLALLLCLPFVLRRGIKCLATKRIGLHFLRASTGLLSYVFLFFPMKSITLVNATLLGNAAPLFLPFVFWVWMGKKISASLWACILVGYLGVFLILNPSGDFVGSWMALMALMSSLFSAIALQCVRNLTYTESSLRIVFYYFLIASILTLPFFLIEYRSFSSNEWLTLIGVGASLGMTQLLLARAYIYANPTVLGPFNYSVVVFAGIIQWYFWDLVPSTLHFVGIFFVCLGGILTILQQKKEKKTN